MENKELIVESTPFEQDLDRVYREHVRSALSGRNKEYGDTNLMTWGEIGIVVRLYDKLARMSNELETAGLMSMQWSKYEQTKESKKARKEVWRDIAGYALQALRLVDETMGALPEEAT